MPDQFDSGIWRRRVVAARGTGPSEALLGGGSVFNVFTGEVIEADVAIVGGVIAGVGAYGQGWETWDCRGKIIIPAFVDPHMHIETSMLWVDEFARAVVPHGTGAVVCDPHEIANVAGLAGVQAMRDAATGLPIDIFFTAPSCVPASAWESPGALFTAKEIAIMLEWPETVGLGELMDVRAATSADAQVGAKLRAASGRMVDGHAPGIGARPLQAYLQSGVGADHETIDQDEAMLKLRNGLMVMIREGTTEQNLEELLPIVTDQTWPRCCFCTDDRDSATLLHRGHIDDVVRRAIQLGMSPARAIQLATWNPAHHWQLPKMGAVAAGYAANLLVLDDLDSIDIHWVMHRGKMVARQGQLLAELPEAQIPVVLNNSVNVTPLTAEDLRLPAAKAKEAVQVVPGQIVTGLANIKPALDGDYAVSDPANDLLKFACIERHRATGRVGTGYVRGLGLDRGAIASSVSHDAHNIVVAGVTDADMLAAVAAVVEMQGGLAVVDQGQVIARLPLPISGIMSDKSAAEVAASMTEVDTAARELGSDLDSPFGILTFLALSVIPHTRITDKGFVHVT